MTEEGKRSHHLIGVDAGGGHTRQLQHGQLGAQALRVEGQHIDAS